MPYTLLSNKVNGRATIHVISANSGDIIVVGNSTVSNLTANSVEVISGAAIRRVSWGTDGNIKILRGANVVLVLTQSDQLDLDGCAITLDSTANIVINVSSANSFAVLEISKQFSTFSNVGGY